MPGVLKIVGSCAPIVGTLIRSFVCGMNVVNTDIIGEAQFRERGGNNLKTV